MVNETRMPEGLEGFGEFLVGMPPRMGMELVAGMLQSSGCPDANFDARELMRMVTGEDPYVRQDPLTEEEVVRLVTLAARRFERYPLQYLAGRWPFLNFEVQVGEGVLIPRADSEPVCLAAIEKVKGLEAPAVLDLCAGSGCLGLGVKKFVPSAQVTAVEKSPEALVWLNKNAAEALEGFSAEQPALTVEEGDAFVWQEGKAEESFDLIVTNPPYLTADEMLVLQAEVRFEPAMALDGGADGLDFYRHIAAAYLPLVKHGGWLVAEFGWLQWEAVKNLLEQAGWTEVTILKDLEGRRRGAAAKRP